MAKYGDRSAVSFDATFETNTPWIKTSSCSTVLLILFWDWHPFPFSLDLMNYNLLAVSVQYPIYTVMVFDEWHNGVPVVYIIMNRCQDEDILVWLTKLRNRVLVVSPSWLPITVIVDCVQAELNYITYAYFYILFCHSSL
jgi:hypothetical protein